MDGDHDASPGQAPSSKAIHTVVEKDWNLVQCRACPRSAQGESTRAYANLLAMQLSACRTTVTEEETTERPRQSAGDGDGLEGRGRLREGI